MKSRTPLLVAIHTSSLSLQCPLSKCISISPPLLINLKDSEFSDYLNWANSIGARKVVVREMFNLDYGLKNNQHVAIVDFFYALGIKDYTLSGRNPIYFRNNLEVEFEFPEMTLHADGKIRRGWRDEI